MAFALGRVSRLVSSFGASVSLGVRAFRQAWTGTPSLAPEEWGEWELRAGRYELLWAFYRMNQYEGNIHRWADRFKSESGLYTDIRTVFGSGRRLGEFWAAHLLGGSLDSEAGNGSDRPSALPIVEIDEAFRKPIARLWLDSDWQAKKDIVGRFGAVMGDVGIEVVDDMDRGKVRLDAVHPGKIRRLVKDPYGNVTSYIKVERREDPEKTTILGMPQWCTYGLQVDLMDDGVTVCYQTTKDGNPFNWADNPSDAPASGRDAGVWYRDYGFVPLVMIQHIDIGQGWGDSEVYGILSRTMESDGLGSMLHDQVAKLLNAPWMMSGVSQINLELTSGKTVIPIFKAPADAKATPLVAPMPIEDVRKVIEMLMGVIDLDYPELMVDRARSSGDMSGKTLREARKPAETKVQSRRASYDRAIVQAQRMALAIGGMNSYDGYEGVPADASENGPLKHRIADRNVFKLDSFDRYEERLQRAAGVSAHIAFGMPVEDAMKQYDYEPDVIARTVTEAARREKLQIQQQVNKRGGGSNSSGSPSPQQVTTRPALERQPVN